MKRVYAPAGACIFCRDFVGPHRKTDLADEHIIAYSLGGTQTLPHATCRVHQALTTKLDSEMAFQWLNFARHVMELPSRTRSEQKPVYRVTVSNPATGISYFTDVPVDSLSRLYIYQNLVTPGILAGTPPLPFRGSPICFPSDEGLHRFMRQLPQGAKAELKSGKYVVGQFERMLAKVAHTYATAELGHGNFIPILLDLIENGLENASHFVGGFEPPLEQEKVEFSWREEVRNGTRYVVASVSFKALQDLPRYQAVVGILLDPAPFPERSKRARDSADDDRKNEQRSKAIASGLFGKKKDKRQSIRAGRTNLSP